MKLRELIEKYESLKKVYDKCSYQRIFDLLNAFKEIKTKRQEYEERRQEIIQEYADEDGQVPTDRRQKATIEANKMLAAEVKLNQSLKFSAEEAKQAGLTGSEIASISEFINFKNT